jgi:hypothetical protein
MIEIFMQQPGGWGRRVEYTPSVRMMDTATVAYTVTITTAMIILI